jgi:hypothetical protein
VRARALAAVLELERFLEMLAGPAREQGFLELRYRLEDGERMGRCFEHDTRLPGFSGDEQVPAPELGRRPRAGVSARAGLEAA